MQAIQALPEAERMVTTLHYLGGYSHAEVAAFLEVRPTDVNNRLHAARGRLRERMLHIIDETLKSHALPAGFAERVVRLVASDTDLKGARKHLGNGFCGGRRPEMFASIESARRENIYIVGEEGETTSAGWFDGVLRPT